MTFSNVSPLKLPASPTTTSEPPSRVGRSRRLSDFSFPESWPSTPSAKAPRLSPNTPAPSKRLLSPNNQTNDPFQGQQIMNEIYDSFFLLFIFYIYFPQCAVPFYT